MNKKKIAVFATGWSSDILEKYVTGLYNGLLSCAADLYLFLSYALPSDAPETIEGELNIFNLPDLHDFDGAAILANGMDFEGLFESLTRRCHEAGIPVVCTGRKPDEQSYFIASDNYAGARALYSHLAEKHDCSDVFFIAGAKDNPDSNIRMTVLREILESKGYSLPDDHVIYSNWEPRYAREYVFEILNGTRKMPKVIVCANDLLAINACKAFTDNNYHVPEDVIIVGYDNEFFGTIYTPTLSTVDQSFDKIGEKAGEVLVDLFNGNECEHKIYVPSRFIIGCSCGCADVSEAAFHREEFCKDYYLNNVKDSVYNINLSLYEKAILRGSRYLELGDNLKEYIARSNFFEGEVYHMVLEPNFSLSIQDINSPFITNGYSREMEAVVSREYDSILANETIRSEKLVPQISESIEKNRFFLFLPLHENALNYGYLVMGDDFAKLGDFNHLYGYITRTCLFLEMFRSQLSIRNLNSRLMELNLQDALTHVKNRSAYIKHEDNLRHELELNPDYNFAIVMFDINNLKIVNDQFGHEYGDKYIIGSSKMICSIYKCSPVYRIGGDEFAVVLTGSDYEKRDELLQKIRDTVAELAASDLPIHQQYSVASGMSVYDPKSDTSVAEVFARADEAMYENKAKMKGSKESIR